MKFFEDLKKKRIILEDETTKFDLVEGKGVEKTPKNAIKINLKKIAQKNIAVSKNKLFTKYLYQTKDKKKYIGTNEITLSFLYEVLKDMTGKSFFIITTPYSKGALFVLNKNDYKFVNKQAEDYEIIKETYFQGAEPYEVKDITDIITRLSKAEKEKKRKYLIYVMAGLFLILMVVVLSTGGEDENISVEEFNKMNAVHKTKKNKKKIPTKEEVKKIIPYYTAKALNTNYLLNNLLYNQINEFDSIFIKSIKFNGNTVEYASFIPIKGFKKNGKFYTKRIKYQPDLKTIWSMYQNNFINSNPEDCENIIDSITEGNILSISEDGNIKSYKLDKALSPEIETFFFKNLLHCPVSITGNAEFDLKKYKVNNNLKIELFYKQ